MAAPLIAGNDLRVMSEEIRGILTNTEVSAVIRTHWAFRVVWSWTAATAFRSGPSP